MVFHRGRRKCLGDIELFIDNTKINETNTIKYLVVIIDAKLNWIKSYNIRKNKIVKGFGIIRKAKPLLNKGAHTNLITLAFTPTYYIVWKCGAVTKLSIHLLFCSHRKKY